MLLIRNTLHSYSGCLKTYGFILFLSIFIYVLSRWGCDHPLNSVPGNGTGFPDTEKPRNQTLSSDCEAKVRRNLILTKQINLRLFRGL